MTSLKNLAWKLLAYVLSRKPVANYIIKRAQRTPYEHLEGYMNRWWLFNAYGSGKNGDYSRKYNWLPSIRVHQILRPDVAEHLHDHPWDARTIILKGWYFEKKLNSYSLHFKGATNPIKFGDYHEITLVGSSTYTLFFTWKYMGTWGFLVDGKKMPWREYEEKFPARTY